MSDALVERLIEESDMRWNGDVYVGDGADLANLVRAALAAREADGGKAVELPPALVVTAEGSHHDYYAEGWNDCRRKVRELASQEPSPVKDSLTTVPAQPSAILSATEGRSNG